MESAEPLDQDWPVESELPEEWEEPLDSEYPEDWAAELEWLSEAVDPTPMDMELLDPCEAPAD